MKEILLIALISFTLSLNKETRIVIPIDKEFKSTLYNASAPNIPIITTYSTSLPQNTFTLRFNHSTPISDGNSTIIDPLPKRNEGNFSFSSNSTSMKPFALGYNTIEHYNDSMSSIEVSLALNNDLGSNNFINQLYAQKLLQSTQFSFYYNESANHSQLFLGDFSTGTNISNIFNSLSYCQTKTSNWECQIALMSLKTQHYKIYSNLIIDTSSSIVSLPLSDYKLLLKYYLGEDNCIKDIDNQIKCKCSSPSIYDNIKLTLDNREGFSLNPKYLIDYYQNDTYQCHWKLYVNKEDDLSNWIIGRPGLVNSFYSFDLKTKRFGFIQDVTHINSPPQKEVIINEDKESSGYRSKFGWVLTLVIVFLIMWGVYQFATTGTILGSFQKRKRNSLDINDNDDRKHIISISKMFQKEESNESDTKKKGELVEMKEMLIDKK